VTEVLTGEIVTTWTPEHAAAHVAEAWQDAVEAIVETGRRLIEARQRVPEGDWLKAVDRMPFGDRTARYLMQIARHPDLQDRNYNSDLPASWTTLAALAELPAGEIPKRIEAGEITPELRGATARAWAATYGVAKQESLNAYSSAVDGLTVVLSYVKTWTPPADIPASHLPLSEFKERVMALMEITQNWSEE